MRPSKPRTSMLPLTLLLLLLLPVLSQPNPSVVTKEDTIASPEDIIDSVFGTNGRGPSATINPDPNPIQTQHDSDSPNSNYLAGFHQNPDGTISQVTMTLPPDSALHELPIEWRRQQRQGDDAMRDRLYGKAAAIYHGIADNPRLYGKMGEQNKYMLHLSYGRALVMTADSANANLAAASFLQAVTLTDSPRDAYFNLGELKVRGGDLKGALNDFKNCLYHTHSVQALTGNQQVGATDKHVHTNAHETSALQAVGVLYIILGDLPTGRHYIQRVTQMWEQSGSNLIKMMQAKGDPALVHELSHWLLDYLLSAFETTPQYSSPVPQSPKDFAMLSYFVTEQESFSARMHYDFGISLFDLGVWDMARMHMDVYGLQKMLTHPPAKEDEGYDNYTKRLSLMRLRVALDVPLVLEDEKDVEQMWDDVGSKFAGFLEGDGSMPTPNADVLQDAVGGLSNLHYSGIDVNIMRDIDTVLRAGCDYLNTVSPNLLERTGGEETSGGGSRIRVGIVSQFLNSHPVGRVTMPMVASLPRDKFRVTIFAFPTVVDAWAKAISWSADNYTPLPMDFKVAAEAISNSNVDVLLFPDQSDVVSMLLSRMRLAPVMAGYYVRGAGARGDSGLGVLDYMLVPDILPAETGAEEQLVRLKGFGLPFDPPHEFRRKEVYEVKGRKFYSNENVYVVLSSVPESVQPRMDAVIREIIKRDKAAVVVLAPDQAEVALSAPTSSKVSAKLGPAQWQMKLVERVRKGLDRTEAERILLLEGGGLDVNERMDLLRFCVCVLDLTGGGIALLESIALGVPVVAWTGLGKALNELVGGAGGSACVSKEGLEGMGEVAVRLGLDEGLRATVVASYRAARREGKLADIVQDIGSVGRVGGGEDVAKWLERVGQEHANERVAISRR